MSKLFKRKSKKNAEQNSLLEYTNMNDNGSITTGYQEFTEKQVVALFHPYDGDESFHDAVVHEVHANGMISLIVNVNSNLIGCSKNRNIQRKIYGKLQGHDIIKGKRNEFVTATRAFVGRRMVSATIGSKVCRKDGLPRLKIEYDGTDLARYLVSKEIMKPH